MVMPDRYKEEIRKEQEYARKERDEKRPQLIKWAEQSICDTLASIGFEISDISAEHGCPFKILVRSQCYSFLADIKLRRLIRPIPIAIWKVDSYNNYISDVQSRLLIFKSRGRNDNCPDRKSHGYPDCFIPVSDIPKRCYTVGPYYNIEHYHTTSLSALRKIVECFYHKT